MTGSLSAPAPGDLNGGAARHNRWLQRALAAGNRAGVKVIPHLPGGLKRLLSGGRAISIDGNTLDPSIQMMLAAQRAVGMNSLVVADNAIATRVQNREATRSLDEADVYVAHIAPVSIPGPAGTIGARHYRPAGEGPAPLLVFYHGGGYVFGDLETHDSACRLICRDAGVHVLAVDYRLAPEHKAPAAVDDAYAAYLWAREHAAELGADPDRVAVGGDSAGGCLAAVVTRLARDAGEPLPALQWLIYPVTDMRGVTRSRTLFADGFLLTKHNIDWFRDAYVDGSGIEVSDPRVSPLLTEDLSGLSPALVITAGFDPLRDEGENYAAKLRAAGVTVDARRMGPMVHAFLNFNALGGQVSRANAEMISALRAHLARG
ncbi:alpha/beta hydrolase [Mycolicibacterium sp. CH28]|uniref:alpha/beta hydrolase n=1 Tax=Mycolicibacterium sp. CH28 TaxID=2512237 RepID=UPI00108220D4|nr:alpha/beta hydrolase fold domain-containing protein [Mycolicibacterium sp. CH28]TGD88043.1 alpha/beta hydrolase [Mycolicibacterium sp. CH28]